MKLLLCRLVDLSCGPQNPCGARSGRGDLKSQGFYLRCGQGTGSGESLKLSGSWPRICNSELVSNKVKGDDLQLRLSSDLYMCVVTCKSLYSHTHLLCVHIII